MNLCQTKELEGLVRVENHNNKIEICKYCGVEFEKSKKHKLGKFCSNKCSVEYRKYNNDPNCKCPVCGLEFYMKQSQINKNKTTTCGIVCSNKLRSLNLKGEGNHQFGLKGNKNSSFKDGETLKDKYIRVYSPDHPHCDKSGRVLKHRLIAENYLLNEYNSVDINGIKYLSLDFAVHHLDLNKLNNNLDNLIVLTHSQHTFLHNMI